MVKEITYEKYKEFCKNFIGKDIFFYIRNLFVKFPDDETIYGVKYDLNRGPDAVYSEICEQNTLTIYSLSEFISGVPIVTKELRKNVNIELYAGKDILVVI